MWSACSVFALTGPPCTGVLVKRFSMASVGHWTGGNLFVAGCLLVVVILTERRADRTKERDTMQSLESVGTMSDT